MKHTAVVFHFTPLFSVPFHSFPPIGKFDYSKGESGCRQPIRIRKKKLAVPSLFENTVKNE